MLFQLINKRYENTSPNINHSKYHLLFNSNNMIYSGSWNAKFLKEGFGISIDKDGNKYIGNWKDDKFDGYLSQVLFLFV